MEFADTERVSLKLNKMQLTGRLHRLLQVASYDPSAEYLATFSISVPHGKLQMAAHKFVFEYVTTLCGSSIMYHLYRPSISISEKGQTALIGYLAKSKVVYPLTEMDEVAEYSW